MKKPSEKWEKHCGKLKNFVVNCDLTGAVEGGSKNTQLIYLQDGK